MNETLKTTDKLEKGKEYTFTFSSGKAINLWTDNGVKKALQEKINPYAEIVSVDRGLLSGNYVVKMIAKKNMALNVYKVAFSGYWETMGFTGADFIEARPGSESGKPGGIVEALPAVGKTIAETIGATAAPLAGSVGQTVAAAIKPLAIYLIPVVAFFIYLEYRKKA